jgi:copper resistance protein D
MSDTLLVRFLHLAAAPTWVGGMLFVALVLLPVTRRLEDPLVHTAGVRFRAVGWIAIGLLLATGLVNTWLRPELLILTRFWVKLGLVALVLVLGVLHDFVLGPRAGRPDAPPSMRPAASWVARVRCSPSSSASASPSAELRGTGPRAKARRREAILNGRRVFAS